MTHSTPVHDRISKIALHRGLSFLLEPSEWWFLTPKSQVRLVLFDIDGTLVRTGGAGVRAFHRVASEVFYRAEGVNGLHFAGRTDRALVVEFFERAQLPVNEFSIQKFLDAYLNLLEEHLQRSAGELCPDVRSSIETLQGLDDGPVLGLLTGNIRRGAELKLKAHELWAPFVFGAFGDDHVDRNQVAEEARRRGSEQLGRLLTGDEILVVGDTPKDVACAQAIGAKSLAVTTGEYGAEELMAAGATWTVSSLGEFPWAAPRSPFYDCKQ
jgi:phosphoglycolate phosphatase-like HAD superfamily hydrolase